MSIQVDLKHLNGFVRNEEMEGIAPQVKTAHHMLHNGTGMGNDYIGWLALPTNYDKEEFERIQKAAKQIQSIPFCRLLIFQRVSSALSLESAVLIWGQGQQ